MGGTYALQCSATVGGASLSVISAYWALDYVDSVHAGAVSAGDGSITGEEGVLLFRALADATLGPEAAAHVNAHVNDGDCSGAGCRQQIGGSALTVTVGVNGGRGIDISPSPIGSGQPAAISGLEVTEIAAAFEGLGLPCASGPNDFPEPAADNVISCTGPSSDGSAEYKGRAEYRAETEVVFLVATSLPASDPGEGAQPLLSAVGDLAEGTENQAAARAWLSAVRQDPACRGVDCSASFGAIRFNLQTGDAGAVTVNLSPV